MQTLSKTSSIYWNNPEMQLIKKVGRLSLLSSLEGNDKSFMICQPYSLVTFRQLKLLD